MGQQQLLLLVLGIVIVGLAVVTGIEAFEENARKASIDRLSVQASDYATKMLAWKLTPQALGGGQSATRFSGFSLSNFGLSASGTTVTHFGNSQQDTWASSGDTYVALWQMNSSNSNVAPHVTLYDPQQDVEIAVFVHGTKPECLVHRIAYIQDGTRVNIPSLHPPNPDATNCSL